MDKVKNEEVRRRAGKEMELASRLGWRLGWMDGVKVALGNRGMTVEVVRQCAKDWKQWRALVHM